MISKEILGAIFGHLAVLIYLCGVVSKKGFSILNGNWISVKLVCKCVAAALLTPTEARLKYPRYKQNNRFHEFL